MFQLLKLNSFKIQSLILDWIPLETKLSSQLPADDLKLKVHSSILKHQKWAGVKFADLDWVYFEQGIMSKFVPLGYFIRLS